MKKITRKSKKVKDKIISYLDGDLQVLLPHSAPPVVVMTSFFFLFFDLKKDV
jgi:hypothetical protein